MGYANASTTCSLSAYDSLSSVVFSFASNDMYPSLKEFKGISDMYLQRTWESPKTRRAVTSSHVVRLV